MSKMIASTYEVYEKIGSGGGGNVYLARHLRLDKKVVLKEDKRELTLRPERLRREVDILKNLSHSHIPQVYDFFVENQKVYTVMELIEGESLDRPLKRGETFSQPQVIRWARQLLEALGYLHSPIHGEPPRGYVHSDIKPANLMRTPYGDICLIDFNIALAIGEENVVGCSAGYASPEHYGYDFSSDGATATANDRTAYMEEDASTLPLSQEHSSSSSKKVVIPDARSDIYSVGATLYHLLSGRKPARNALDVTPLSEQEFSPQIVKIITKAMDPNPELRYQTAEEMLEAFLHLRENDPRVKKSRKRQMLAWACTGAFLLAGVSSAFVGLKRMQTKERWLKLAEYSANALEKGDSVKAISYALEALPEKGGPLTPRSLPQVQKALTDALGVYDLSDGFKTYKTLELPTEPLALAIGPDGRTAVGIYPGFAAVFDTETAEIAVTLPAEDSALSEVEYLDEGTILYAGKGGIRAYDIRTNTELWKGKPATAISISGDKSKAAALYRDEPFAIVYDTATGEELGRADFGGRSQRISINDQFASLNENIFALNEDGSLLGASFADGSLEILDWQTGEKTISVMEKGSGYTHFEGGFYQKYFAFSAANPAGDAVSNTVVRDAAAEEPDGNPVSDAAGGGEEGSPAAGSLFAVVDTEEKRQMGGFEAEGYCGVSVDENGIYVQSGNILVKIDPVTGEQKPLASTSANLARFAKSDTHVAAASDDGLLFFDQNAELITERPEEYRSDFVQIAGETALAGSLDSPAIRILKYENHSEANIFTYDPLYQHDEARLSADGETVMLFSYQQFRIYRMDGTMAAEVSLPNPEQVYDQQYIRKDGESVLEVTYQDGTVAVYSGADGALLEERTGEQPDLTLAEEFFTDTLRITAPLHGTAVAYEKESGKLVSELEKDAYLTYVEQAGAYVVTFYRRADGTSYGILLNESCEALACLPCLCDVVGEELVFGYPTGNLRKVGLYELEELMKMGKEVCKVE